MPEPEYRRILFSLYKWCPRNPSAPTSLEEHQSQFLVHHWYEGQMCCTSAEALPPDYRDGLVSTDKRGETYNIKTNIRFDTNRGELIETEGIVQQIIQIRRQLLDDALLGAVIFELERRGYTVTPPQ